MKTLAFALALLLPLAGRAATPSFSSFNPAQFTTNNLRIGIRSNAFSGTTVVLSNSTVIVTNSYLTINNTTNLVDNSVNIVTNSYTTFSYTTNLIDNSTVIITNTTVIITNVTWIVNGGTNDITQLWRTNALGIYLPKITNTPTIAVGQSAEALGVSADDGLVIVHDASAGDSTNNTLRLIATSSTNSGSFISTAQSGVGPYASFQFAATNAGVLSQFTGGVYPQLGQVKLALVNGPITDFSVSNQITAVQALQFVPAANPTLDVGPNTVNVASNSYVTLLSPSADPALATISLTAAQREGMPLILLNTSTAKGFTLFNGSPLADDGAKWVTLPNGDWISSDYGDGMLLVSGPNGWSEIGRFSANTNVVTGAQLWELVSGHMRTTGSTTNDWQFRTLGVPQVTISSDGNSIWGVNGNATNQLTLRSAGKDINFTATGNFLEIRQPQSGPSAIFSLGLDIGSPSMTFDSGGASYNWSPTFFNYLTDQVMDGNPLTVIALPLGFQLASAAGATAAQNENSPAFMWFGHGWSTNAAESVNMQMSAWVQTHNAAAYPSAEWLLQASISNQPPVTVFAVNTSGSISTGTDTNQWQFLGFTVDGGTTNAHFNVNGTNFHTAFIPD